ncbi:MAG TPA: hypothetical protein VKS60_11970 [Stellaceae bacterium]|nr:hypothetical protein [Stellaceae bacterium]
MKHIATVAILVVLLGCVRAAGLEPEREGQQSFLKRAIFADGRLWTLSDAGVLSSTADNDSGWTREQPGSSVLDVCAQSGMLASISSSMLGLGPWVLQRHSQGAWSIVATVAGAPDRFLAMDCSGGMITIVTNRRLIEAQAGTVRDLPLQEPFNPFGLTATYSTRDWIYLGFDRGEWGGGISRIDRHTGAVSVIEKKETGDLCSGPLDSKCDPVNAIVADPWKPDCIVAAIGLVHFIPRGRIIEVCGNDVRQLYSKSYADPEPSEGAARTVNLCAEHCSVAFFGLAVTGSTVWASGIDGVYRLIADGGAEFHSLPGFKDVGGIGVSFELPRLVLVLTRVNQRTSVSGNAPMLVAR